MLPALLILIATIALAVIFYSVINPLSLKYSVEPESLVNEYDKYITYDSIGNEITNANIDNDGSGSSLTQMSITNYKANEFIETNGILNIFNTDDEVLDEMFKDVSSSKLSFLENIIVLAYDWFGKLFGDIGNYSSALVRKLIFINVENKLEDMKTEDKEELPIGALLTTLTYAFSSQYLETDHTYLSAIGGENIEVDRVNVSQPLDMIASLVQKEILTFDDPNDIRDLLDNMVFHKFYPVYEWGEVDRDCNESENTCKIYIGCGNVSENGVANRRHPIAVDEYELDYLKYYLYLRFGSYASGFAMDGRDNKKDPLPNYRDRINVEYLWGKTDVPKFNQISLYTTAFGYEYFKNLSDSYNKSAEQCSLYTVAETTFKEFKSYTDENGIYYEYVFDEESIENANNFFKERDVTDGIDTINEMHEIFANPSKYLTAADIEGESQEKVTLQINNVNPNGDGTFKVNSLSGEYIEYKSGWIYNRFPFYRADFQPKNSNGEPYEYNEVSTPIKIERVISYIDESKDIYNDVMGYQNKYSSTINDFTQSFNFDGTESFPLPVGKYTITSCFGGRIINGKYSNHGGIDLAVTRNTPLYTWRSGKVVAINNGCGEGYYGSKCGGGYGNYVVVDHGLINGEKVFTVYGHMSVVSVSVGDSIYTGQQIGTSGNSGSSTGPHLHFEIRIGQSDWKNATKQNPYETLLEIVGEKSLSNTCQEGTFFDL